MGALPEGPAYHSFDALYERGDCFDGVYDEIAQRVVALGERPDGVVYAADALTFGSAPHNLLIDHPELGYTVLYGHLLERPQLDPGQTVRTGDVVALSGDPAETCYGRPHLHLEVRSSSNRARKLNPVLLIQADWDNLSLVGPFSPGFQYDLDDPRKWQHLDDQPESVSGGALLNEFANPWPPDRSGR